MAAIPDVTYLDCLPNLRGKCPGKAETRNKSDNIDHANNITGDVHVLSATVAERAGRMVLGWSQGGTI